jgi:hypothetical protein
MTVDEFNKKLDQMKLEFQKEFLKRVQDKTPIRSGNMHAGWFWDNEDPNLPVFSNAMYYAIYVENGTEHQRPQMMVATTVLEGPDILKVAAKAAGL